MTIFHTGLTPEQAMLKRLRITYGRLEKELCEIGACLQAQDPAYKILGERVLFTINDEIDGEVEETGLVTSIKPHADHRWLYEIQCGDSAFYEIVHDDIIKFEVL